MAEELQNLLEKFKDADKHMQWLPVAEGHVIMLPRRNAPFIVSKALEHMDSDTDFFDALKKRAVDDYGTIFRYLRHSHKRSDLATRAKQVIIDTGCFDRITW